VLGSEVRHLNPDERSTAALMRRALERPPPTLPSVLWAGFGIYVSRTGLDGILGSWKASFRLLDEKGEDAFSDLNPLEPSKDATPMVFILSDDQDLLPEEESLISTSGVPSVSLSRTVLHSYQAITACHLALDRSAPGP